MLNGVNSQAVLHIMTTNHSQKKPNQLHYLPKFIDEHRLLHLCSAIAIVPHARLSTDKSDDDQDRRHYFSKVLPDLSLL